MGNTHSLCRLVYLFLEIINYILLLEIHCKIYNKTDAPLLNYLNPFSEGTVFSRQSLTSIFSRQILTTKDGPRTERVKYV